MLKYHWIALILWVESMETGMEGLFLANKPDLGDEILRFGSI